MNVKKRITNYITNSFFSFFLCIRVTFVTIRKNQEMS